MAINDDECRCIDLACIGLSTALSGHWSRNGQTQSLADGNPGVPTPELIVTDGVRTAAVEVKRLFGDRTWQRYYESIFSLRSYLKPSCGGHYTLAGPVGIRLPLGSKLRRHLKQQIEAVAPGMKVGDETYVKVWRSAPLTLNRVGTPGRLWCCHNVSSDFMKACGSRLPGVFFLSDCGQFEHSVETDQCRRDFCQTVAAAAATVVQGTASTVQWYEEWNWGVRIERTASGSKPFLRLGNPP